MQLPAMRLAMMIVGIIWVAACAVLWIWVGLFSPEPSIGEGWINWTLPRLLADSRFGLAMVPILLAIPGALLIQAGLRRGDRN